MLVATVLLLARRVARAQPRRCGSSSRGRWACSIPHTLATSKTLTATLDRLAAVLSAPRRHDLPGDRRRRVVPRRLARGDAARASSPPGTIPGRAGATRPAGFAAILRENIWVALARVVAALAAAAIVAWACRCAVARATHSRVVLVALASLATLYLAGRMTWIAYRVTERTPALRDRPAFVDLGPRRQRRRCPPNAVLLLENRQKFEHIIAMFYDRPHRLRRHARRRSSRPRRMSSRAGGVPFLVTDRDSAAARRRSPRRWTAGGLCAGSIGVRVRRPHSPTRHPPRCRRRAPPLQHPRNADPPGLASPARRPPRRVAGIRPQRRDDLLPHAAVHLPHRDHHHRRHEVGARQVPQVLPRLPRHPRAHARADDLGPAEGLRTGVEIVYDHPFVDARGGRRPAT